MAGWREKLSSSVAVLLGGNSSEREVSLQSGMAVLTALQAQGVESVAVDTADKYWLQQVQENHAHCFIALHGPGGEDGTVQGALETIGVSYTGSGVMASALAMDKLRCKQLWIGMGLSTPDFSVMDSNSDFQSLMSNWETAIVKPAREGSSIGMTKVHNAEELASAYQLASKYDSLVIAEQWVTGAEFTVAILGEKTLPAICMETDNSFYDYQAKYLSDDTRYLCPCGLAEKDEKALQEIAKQAFSSLSCKGWGRVDFMQNGQGEFLLLEVNTVPGMTSHSLVPMAAKAIGVEFDELVLEIFRLSIEQS